MSQRIQLSQGKWAVVDDGDFEWLCRWRWSASQKGDDYFIAMRMERDADGRQRVISMHRQLITPNSGEIVDHINGDPLDNRRCNLRICTQAQNLLNRRKNRTKQTTRHKGVTWHKGGKKWMAHSRGQYLGLFATEDEAARAYNVEAATFGGEFARLNELEEA